MIFLLARHLRVFFPTADADDLLGIVQRWHIAALPNIRTKSFSESWADFKVAWKKDLLPFGVVLASVVNNLPEAHITHIRPGYDHQIIQLIRLCSGLQSLARDAPFFLGCRIAGEFLGINHTSANALLRLLVDDGILTLVKKGTGLRSSRYRLNPI